MNSIYLIDPRYNRITTHTLRKSLLEEQRLNPELLLLSLSQLETTINTLSTSEPIDGESQIPSWLKLILSIGKPPSCLSIFSRVIILWLFISSTPSYVPSRFVHQTSLTLSYELYKWHEVPLWSYTRSNNVSKNFWIKVPHTQNLLYLASLQKHLICMDEQKGILYKHQGLPCLDTYFFTLNGQTCPTIVLLEVQDIPEMFTFASKNPLTLDGLCQHYQKFWD